MEPIRLILDTDIGDDCDDSAAMAVMHELANAGECEILAVTHCYEGNTYAGCIDGINHYYGRPEIPVGMMHNGRSCQPTAYAGAAALKFPNRFMEGPVPDTVDVMRKALAEAPDASVVLAAIGPMCSLAALVKSEPDAISPLTGRELIRQKIQRTVVMAGCFAEQWPGKVVDENGQTQAEWNVKLDIPAAQTVCEKWPGELVFCSFEIGMALITGKRVEEEGYPWNPVGFCFRTWHSNNHSQQAGRESWDPATVLYAIQPDSGLWDLHEYGRIQIDDRGVTTWQSDTECRHTFVIEKAPLEEVRQAIDEILEKDLLRHQKVN